MKYKRPAHHSEQLIIKTTAELSNSPRAPFHQEACRIDEDKETLLVSADLDLVFVNEKGRPTRVDLQEMCKLLHI